MLGGFAASKSATDQTAWLIQRNVPEAPGSGTFFVLRLEKTVFSAEG